uniref:Immunoglobulin V-set domain-containing protein n=1 Tax=Gouania willdenowi TaxID=441366 RepID=A0A8C5EVG0_GOUWI
AQFQLQPLIFPYLGAHQWSMAVMPCTRARWTTPQVEQHCVHQVTWRRLDEDKSLQNVASYSERFGQQISEPYVNKVVFTEASLSSASIALRNITWQDESCYVCSFDVFPHGSTGNRTCLTVRGIERFPGLEVLY